MKYIKNFESIEIKKYIIATMGNWNYDIYMFRVKYNTDDIIKYDRYYHLENEVVIEYRSSSIYEIDSLIILYQTDNIEEAKEKLFEFDSLYKDVDKYNL